MVNRNKISESKININLVDRESTQWYKGIVFLDNAALDNGVWAAVTEDGMIHPIGHDWRQKHVVSSSAVRP